MILDAYFLNDKLETAVHEAGHAVLAFYSGGTITSTTIKAQGTVAGQVQYTFPTTMAVYIQDSITAAGYAACVLYDGKYDMASENRRQRHSQEAAGDWAKLKGDAYTAVVHATRVLEENWYKVEALAVALLDSLNHTLNGAQVANVLRTARKPVLAASLPQPTAVFVPDYLPTDWDVPVPSASAPAARYLSRSPRNQPTVKVPVPNCKHPNQVCMKCGMYYHSNKTFTSICPDCKNTKPKAKYPNYKCSVCKGHYDSNKLFSATCPDCKAKKGSR